MQEYENQNPGSVDIDPQILGARSLKQWLPCLRDRCQPCRKWRLQTWSRAWWQWAQGRSYSVAEEEGKWITEVLLKSLDDHRPCNPDALTVKSYALTMEELGVAMQAKSQIVRGGGARWRLMRVDRSMACDVDRAGYKAPLWAVETIQIKLECRLKWYSQLIAKAWLSAEENIVIYGEKRVNTRRQVYPKGSGVISWWLSTCSLELLVLTSVRSAAVVPRNLVIPTDGKHAIARRVPASPTGSTFPRQWSNHRLWRRACRR